MKSKPRPVGSISKQDNGRVRVRYTNPHTKVRHYAMFTNVADARAYLAEQLSDTNQGRWKDTGATMPAA
jgi:hypothetical protein